MNYSKNPFKFLLRQISVLLIKYLQWRYKRISLKNRYGQTNQVISRLVLIQSLLYFFKEQFSAWGYFHYSCLWTERDERYFRKVFPVKTFEELAIVVWSNPEAVTYYHNRIFNLLGGHSPDYTKEIQSQLTKWGKWN